MKGTQEKDVGQSRRRTVKSEETQGQAAPEGWADEAGASVELQAVCTAGPEP